MIIEAIKKINPSAEVSVNGSDINTCTFEWHNGTTPIPVADIKAQLPAVELDMAMEDLRTKRNKLLQDTDYIVTMNLEAGNTVPAEWVTYRQSLRDLTNGLTTVEQVNAVVFPTKPE
jgi:hypothetical protein